MMHSAFRSVAHISTLTLEVSIQAILKAMIVHRFARAIVAAFSLFLFDINLFAHYK